MRESLRVDRWVRQDRRRTPCLPGLDPVSWTRSERRIRCPRCSRRRSPGDHAGSLTRSSRRALCGWVLDDGQTVGRVARELDLTESGLADLGRPGPRRPDERADRANDGGTRGAAPVAERRFACCVRSGRS